MASGETHEVREFVELAFKAAGIEIEWRGSAAEEKGFDKKTGKVLVEVNPKFFRPAEVELLLGSPEKAESALGWKRKITFGELVERMVRNDMIIVSGKQ